METKDLQQLKELAQKATPGPWEYSANPGMVILPEKTTAIARHQPGNNVIATRNDFSPQASDANARFIAAANPATVLNLIAEVERLNALVDLWKRDYEKLVDRTVQLDEEAKRLREREKTLQKEANWLADKCYILCDSIQYCDADCKFYDVCEGYYAPKGKWREAAREAIRGEK